MGLRYELTTGIRNALRRSEPAHLRAARAAWARGDAVFMWRANSTWSTGHWVEADINRRVNEIASCGWVLQGSTREVGHGTLLFTFVRPSNFETGS